MQFLWIAMGGALGALSRFIIGGLLFKRLDIEPPWGTLTVNLSGCLFMGVILSWVEAKSGLSPELRHFIMIGFLGAYTTFSTYMLEIVTLSDQGRYTLALVNILLSTVLGFVFFILGVWCGKACLR